MKFSSSWLPVCMHIGWGDMRVIEGEGGGIASLSLLIALCMDCPGRQVRASRRGKDGMVNVTLFWHREGIGAIVLTVVILLFLMVKKRTCASSFSCYFLYATPVCGIGHTFVTCE